jgi:hypothetical protein
VGLKRKSGGKRDGKEKEKKKEKREKKGGQPNPHSERKNANYKKTILFISFFYLIFLSSSKNLK